MPDIKLTNAGVPAPLTETQIIGAGPPVPSPTLVQADQSTILGDGSHERPLHASSGIPGSIIVQDEGTPVAGAPHTGLDFVGDGVLATDAGGGLVAVTIPGLTVEDEGTPVSGAPHDTLNFVGDGVTVTDAGGGVATVTIPGITANFTTMLIWGLGIFTTTPAFVSPGGTSNDTSGTNDFAFAVPFPGVIRNLIGRHNEAAGSEGDHATYTIVVNGTPTALSVDVPTGVIGQASNLSTTVPVNAGDTVSLTVASVSIGPNVVQAKITAQLAP
jgi:hypothetical protein